VGQLAFALLVFIAWAGPGFFNNNPLSRYSYYFFLLNWSSAVAFGRFLAGKKQALWTPRAG
jgi:hypothetical protein